MLGWPSSPKAPAAEFRSIGGTRRAGKHHERENPWKSVRNLADICDEMQENRENARENSSKRGSRRAVAVKSPFSRDLCAGNSLVSGRFRCCFFGLLFGLFSTFSRAVFSGGA